MSLISPFEIVDHYSMHCWGRAACRDKRNAINGGVKSLAGLGAWYDYIPLSPSARETDLCAPAPIWCTYTPGAQYLKECQPLTEAQIRECQTREFGPALSTASRETALQQGDASVAAYLNNLKVQDPAQYQAYQDSQKRLQCINSGTSAFWCDYGDMVLWGGVGAVAILMLSRR
jgi:hypothetical protein